MIEVPGTFLVILYFIVGFFGFSNSENSDSAKCFSERTIERDLNFSER